MEDSYGQKKKKKASYVVHIAHILPQFDDHKVISWDSSKTDV